MRLRTISIALLALGALFLWLAMAAKYDADIYTLRERQAQRLAEIEQQQREALARCGDNAAVGWVDGRVVCGRHDGRGKLKTESVVAP